MATLKGFVRSRFGKVYTVAMMALVMCMMAVGSAFAAEGDGTPDTTTVGAITSAFADVKATALAALAAIATIAILLFAGIYAWRYGKKVFSIIAK